MSWTCTARRVRDASRSMGERVTALHSLIANHHAPLGFEGTRKELRSRVGVRWRHWTEAQLLAALALLEESRASHLAHRSAWDARRSAEKAAGRRQPTAHDLAILHERVWLKDPSDARTRPGGDG